MSEQRTIQAYGVVKVLSVEAQDGYVLIEALMQGGTKTRFAMLPAVSGRLRPMLRDAERAAVDQRKLLNKSTPLPNAKASST